MKTSLAANPGRQAVIDFLLTEERVDSSAVARAELVASRTRQPLEQALNQMGALSDDDLVDAYVACGCEAWSPDKLPPSVKPEELGVASDFLTRNRILPLQLNRKGLLCAACDPLDDETLSGLVFALGKPVRVLAGKPADIMRGLDQMTGGQVANEPDAPDERRLSEEMEGAADLGGAGSGARLVASVFEAAISAGASDIHFEPRRHDLQVRLRVDGRLIHHRTVPGDLAGPAVSRVKVLANLDLGERRLPQDGRTTFVVAGRQIDVRVATSPSVFGEAAVLRILDRASLRLELEALGLNEGVVDILRRVATAPHGLFLVTGPTGSGKTTTLYALLQTFVGSAKKVLSVEDPVEYQFDHVVQTQVAPQIGLTFASALRSFLRQDPDVILVGEIRDRETAAVAVQAAMTGHLVLASVHANDACGIIPRLRDMGVEPYQLAAGLRGAAAQRLVRRLCPSCRRRRPPTEAELAFASSLKCDLPTAFEAPGCSSCGGSGYKGRMAIGEAFLTTEPLLRAIAEEHPHAEVERLVRSEGFEEMAKDGVGKAALGLTSMEDVMAAVDV
jgi:general secretion pathway protein E